MSLLKLIKRVVRKVLNIPVDIYKVWMKRKQKKNILTHSDKDRIYLFCAPIHSNVGDQAQLLCWLKLFKQWYPNYEVVEVSTKYSDWLTLREIRSQLRDSDKLFIHSGYLFFDYHPELPFILNVIRAFYDKPITILPQTMNVMNEWMRNVVARELDLHQNLTFICRDEVSLEKSKTMFKNVHLRLMPDVVTSLIGKEDFSLDKTERSGIMFCLRDDMEKHYSEDKLRSLMAQFKGTRTGRCDTTIKARIYSWPRKRKQLIGSIVEKFAKYEVIVTDRYHGIILSAVANTPVVVINSSDHKLSSGVNWFKKLGFSSVVFAPTLEEAAKLAHEILDSKTRITNSAKFYNEYWAKDPF